MTYDHYSSLAVSIDENGIATLLLNKPETMNRVDEALHDELGTIFTDLAADARIKIIVMEGAGDHFSAGGDLRWMKDANEGRANIPDARIAKQIIFSLLDLPQPIIAKVRGACVGLGATMALMCDAIYAAEDATIADPHVKVGIVAGDGGAVIWPQLIGYARAKEYLMTGDPLTGKRAAEIGLVNHAVANDALDDAVAAYAMKLRKGALQAIRHTKTSVNLALKQVCLQVLDASIAYEIETFRSADHTEAISAFLEKREPNFQDQ